MLKVHFGLITVGNALAASLPSIQYYPPSGFTSASLAQAINGTSAPGIYDTSYTPDDQYGSYNWCDMPHVRASEYTVPPSNFSLTYVEVIQRHHKRTPYASNTFFKEDISWNCNNEGPFHGAKDAYQFNTSQIYWQQAYNTPNPFEYTVGPGFQNSTCQFPSITSEGLEDARQHGIDFAGVYGELLGFLPDASEREKYQWRVTNNVITTQTLSGYLQGVFPGSDLDYAIIQPSTWDSLEPAFSCDLYSAVSSGVRGSNTNWTTHLTASADLRSRFNNVSGIQPDDTAGWNTSWDHPYDNLSAKQCHSLPLPCSVNNTNTCLTQNDANEVYRLGNWEYAYTWRGAQNSTLASVLKMGPWVQELQAHLQGAMSGTSCVKYFHNFAHDGSIAPLLGLLQIDNPVWPGMGSEIVFELYENAGSYYLRVLWGGQPLKTSTPLGTLDMVPIDDFNKYIDSMMPSNFVDLCNA